MTVWFGEKLVGNYQQRFALQAFKIQTGFSVDFCNNTKPACNHFEVEINQVNQLSECNSRNGWLVRVKVKAL